MTTHQAILLGCDGPDEGVPCPVGNGFWRLGSALSDADVDRAEEAAERDGWTVMRGDPPAGSGATETVHYFCPECVKEIGR